MDNGACSYHRFLEGDKEAFRDIIDLYRTGLLFFTNGITHDLSAAEEIVEDSFVELIVHPRRYNFSVSLKTYIYTIAKNKAYNYIKKHARQATIGIDEITELADLNESFESQICRKEKNRALYGAMQRLNHDYRTVLYLFYFEDMGYAEAGRIMKKNRKQIENLLYRAKASLKAELRRDGFEYEE